MDYLWLKAGAVVLLAFLGGLFGLIREEEEEPRDKLLE